MVDDDKRTPEQRAADQAALDARAKEMADAWAERELARLIALDDQDAKS